MEATKSQLERELADMRKTYNDDIRTLQGGVAPGRMLDRGEGRKGPAILLLLVGLWPEDASSQ